MAYPLTLVRALCPLAMVFASAASLAPGKLEAGTRTWDPPGGNFFWHVAENWDPEGIPTTNDDVEIPSGFCQLNADTAAVNSLIMTGGAMVTNGFTLFVLDGGAGLLQVFGSAGGVPVLNLFPTVDSSDALVTDFTQIGNDGRITFNSLGPGDSVSGLFRSLQILPGGELRASGDGETSLEFTVGGPFNLVNDGLFTIEGTVLLNPSDTQGELDLDGSSETGVVVIEPASTLSIQASVLDPLNSSVSVGDGGGLATLEVNFAQPVQWNIGPGGEVVLDNGEVITDDPLLNQGTVRGWGQMNVESFSNGGTLSAEGGTLTVFHTAQMGLDLDGPSGNGVLNALDGNMIIFSGVLPATIAFTGTMNIGESRDFLAQFVTFELLGNAVVNLTGGLFLTQDLRLDMPAGSFSVLAGPESHIIAADTRLVAGGVHLDSDLRVNGLTIVRPNAVVDGAGTLIVDGSGRLTANDSLVIGVSVRNEGIVAPGTDPSDIPPPFDQPGHLQITGDCTQTATGILEIELDAPARGAPDFDTLGVDGDLVLGGTLDVTLAQGFVPDQGTVYTIITYGGNRSGSFDHFNLPPLGGLDWAVNYPPNAIELEVISPETPFMENGFENP